MASGGESSEGLKYKVLVLKVSVHCEGCKKTIEKILKKAKDVYKYEIDAAKKKVTVMGNVDANTLIRKLRKAGKNAQLWPEKTSAIPNPKTNDEKGKDEIKEAPKSKEPQPKSAEKKAAPAVAAKSSPAAADPAKHADSGKKTEASPESSKESEAFKKEAAKFDEKKAESAAPPPEKPPVAAAASASSQEKASVVPEANGNASEGKKKGKKAQEEVSEEAAADNKSVSSYATAAAVAEADVDTGVRGVESLVQHVQPMYNQPPAYFPGKAPPPPAYVMSYNMSQPSVSHAYYAPSIPESPPQEYNYASYHPYYQPYPPAPANYYGEAAVAPSSSYHQLHSYDSFFSEENPNGCSLM